MQYPLSYIQQAYPKFNWGWLALLVVISLTTIMIDNADLERDLYGFVCLLFGYLFGSSKQFWDWLKVRSTFIVIAAFSLIICYQLGFWLDHQQSDNQVFLYIAALSYNAAKIISLMAVLVIADKIFDKPSAFISRANHYVFPLYVIHQSVLITVAFLVAGLLLPSMQALLLTLFISIAICVVLLWLCKHSALIALLLGKRPGENSLFQTKGAQVFITLITLPLAIRLLGVI